MAVQKRSRSEDDAPLNDFKKTRTEDVETASKKKRRPKKQRTTRLEDFDEEKGVNHALAKLDPQLTVDHLAAQRRRFDDRANVIEMEDWRIPAQAVLDTSSWHGDRALASLPAFMRQFAEAPSHIDLSAAPSAKGSPHTIVVAASGIRAAELVRVLRVFQGKDAMVAKLFAKHIKLAEAAQFVTKTRMNIGVGTPQRLEDLLDTDVLKTEYLRQIIVDASAIDQKKRGILDMRETLKPLVALLSRPNFKSRYQEGDDAIRLLFF